MVEIFSDLTPQNLSNAEEWGGWFSSSWFGEFMVIEDRSGFPSTIGMSFPVEDGMDGLWLE